MAPVAGFHGRASAFTLVPAEWPAASRCVFHSEGVETYHPEEQARLVSDKHRTMQSTALTGRSDGPQGIGVREILIWCALATLYAAGHLFITHGPLLRNDSYEYLSAADNFLAGRPARTSIVYFDSERSAGRIPAPLTTFPAGYPFATAVVAATGVPAKYSASVVSVAALVLLIPAVGFAGRLLSISALLTRVLLVWLVGNSWVAVYGSAVTAESLYTLTSFAAITLFAAGMVRAQADSPRVWPFILGSLLVGLSYWVRYAGLFLFVASASFFAIRSIVIRDKTSRNAAALSIGPAAAVIGAGLLRNELLVGNWKGGNEKAVHHPFASVLRDFLIWMHHLLLGGIAAARVGWLEALLAGGVLALGIVLVAALMRRRRRALTRKTPCLGPRSLLCWYVAVYCGGMIYLGITSVISFDTRMFYPLLPPLLLLLMCGLQSGEPPSYPRSAARAAFLIGLSAATIGYLCIHARSYCAPLGPAPDEIVARELSGMVSPGVTMQSWIASNVPADEVVIANQGQASGYVLRRKTLALASPQYSDQRWNAAAIDHVMRTYDARLLILYGGDAGDDVLRDSPFLAALAGGLPPPGWLVLAAHSRGITVFRRIS